jgi:hypothetical protein
MLNGIGTKTNPIFSSYMNSIIMIRKLLVLSLLTALGSTVIIMLYFISDKVNHRPNGFIRLFPPHLSTPRDILDIKFDSYYFAGATNKSIYLGNSTSPTTILRVNYLLSDTEHINLYLPKIKISQSATEVYVDSPFVFMQNGVFPVILQGVLSSPILRPLEFEKSFFTMTSRISNASFVIRTYDEKKKQNILAKETLDPPRIRYAADILEKQVDGIFCTDGSLLYDKNSRKLVYIYFYRNQFITMDTNLNVIYHGRTIDTNSRAKIKIDKIASDDKVTFSSPPLVVNGHSSIDSNWIYINSELRANNETVDAFDQFSVIDVYYLNSGIYKFSFYVPRFNDKKMNSFKIYGHTLFALYGEHLLSYRLNF